MTNEQMKEFEELYTRISSNPVLFIEEYYNKVHADAQIALTDIEKKWLNERHKKIPILGSFGNFIKKLD
jgi:transposase